MTVLGKHRFDLVEMGTITGFVALVVWVSTQSILLGPGRTTMIEDNVVEMASARFGLQKFSQGPEEWLIREFFNDRRDGVFVDVGAYDARRFSNTYRIEHDLGWRGVAIDAIREFAPGYTTYRPNTRFVVAFVADRDEGTATLHINPKEYATSSGDDDFAHVFAKTTVPREVPRRTLDSILQDAGVEHFDLLSMDIELGEPMALSHFTIARHRPALAVIEAQGQVRQAILDYFARAGYVVVGRYLHADHQNLYFTPLEGKPVPGQN